ncbi:Alpha crystallin/Hsp20 domain [Macleaya cordata]|uniref:Alpha crystallin/Hsp20 domain n=1 Tax=Macleaya cordata TaxID=56857 RepID=A0A200PQ07_MACCD|nr:Alpha crystallin/Hsp20 domain [Macleaya cordata]
MDHMRRQREIGEITTTRLLTYEDFQPSSDWTHDLNCHVLLVDLPGFKKEELKVQVDNSWKVTVSGERKLSENKYSRFKQVFDIPRDSDIEKINGRFDGGLLFVIIPKKKAEILEEPKKEILIPKDIVEEKKQEQAKKEEDPKKKGDDNRHEHAGHDLHGEKKKEMERNGRKEDLNGKKEEKKERKGWVKEVEGMKEKEVLEVFMENAKEIISKNKVAIATAVIAVSVGLYLSHKLRSGGQ